MACVCVCVCVSLCVCMFVCVFVCDCMCSYMYGYVYGYVCTVVRLRSMHMSLKWCMYCKHVQVRVVQRRLNARVSISL